MHMYALRIDNKDIKRCQRSTTKATVVARLAGIILGILIADAFLE